MSSQARRGEETRLRVLTFDVDASKATAALVAMASACADACDGSYDCDCLKCRADRAHRVQAGTRKTRQPWEPRDRGALAA